MKKKKVMAKSVLALLMCAAMLASTVLVGGVGVITVSAAEATTPETVAEADDLLEITGTSRQEVVEHTGKMGLGFRFNLQCEGVTISDTHEGNYTNATVNGNKLIAVGALMSNNPFVGGDEDAFVLGNASDANGSKVINIKAKYLFGEYHQEYYGQVRSGITYAVRITNIPEGFNAADIYARAYYVYEKDGVQTTVYDDVYVADYAQTDEITYTQPAAKFEKKFNKNFLYRVGNVGAVKLDTLFAGENVNGASVKVETVDNTGASGTYTAANAWNDGTIDFNGTGVVKVSIAGDNYSAATTVLLEVVNAKNITSNVGTIEGGDLVLLKDINTSTYVNYWDCTLYGNGFTYSLHGAPTTYNSKQGHGVLIVRNATFDNVVIEGDEYEEYGVYTNNTYYNTAIDAVSGNITIRNCYISGCAAPVKVRGGNVMVVDTTLYGGAVANMILNSGTTTLKNVTTANYNDGRKLVGMGVVVHPEATEVTYLKLEGTLKQYNFLCETDRPSDSDAASVFDTIFGTNTVKYQFGSSPNRYANTGIVSMNKNVDKTHVTGEIPGYEWGTARFNGSDGYVYSQLNTSGTVDNNYLVENDPHNAAVQGPVDPTVTFDYTDKNYVAKQEGSNDYCYEDSGTVYISMDDGDTFNWDTSILTANKAGRDLAYTVTMNGVDYTGKSIAFNTAGDYTVEYTYTDDYNFGLDAEGKLTTYSAEHTKTVTISVAVIEAATKNAEFTFGSGNTASKKVTIGTDTYVMPDVSGTSTDFGSTTVEGQTVYYPIVEIVMSDNKTSHSSGWYAYFPVFANAVTITDYQDQGKGDAVTYNASTTTMPDKMAVDGDPASLFKYQSGSNAGTTPVVKNNILVYSSAKIEANRSEYNTVIKYTYTDNAGTKYYYYIGYHAPAQSYNGCFTPDTLITLADGSQKRVDELQATDKILAWDFFTGTYVEKNISLLVNHGEAEYEIANLTFSDGTKLKTIAEHGVFDYDLNKFVYITVDNMQEYIGHRFVKYNANGDYDVVTLVDANKTVEYTSAWSVSSAVTSNAFASGLLTVAPPEDFYNWIEMDGNLHYDVEQFMADVQTYGLYTYDDFADYVTYDQFVDWNGAYLKIAVEKGHFTFDYILELIEMYKGWMPQN